MLVYAFSTGIYAQSTSWNILPRPSDGLLLNRNIACRAQKVRTREDYMRTKGKPVLKMITTFNSDGRLISERKTGYYKQSVYYTYSGDTTIKRTIEPDNSPNGNGLIHVSVEKINAAGQILLFYEKIYYHMSDSMRMPGISRAYNYSDDLLVSVIQADTLSEYSINDSHGQLIEVKSMNKVEEYRRVYDQNKLIESYYSKGNDPETLIEKLYYYKDGSLSKYETWDKGSVKFTHSFEYDESGRVITEKDNCSIEKYTYNTDGHLIKDETLTCSKSVTSIVYSYNERGLLYSTVKSRTGISFDDIETSTYSYW